MGERRPAHFNREVAMTRAHKLYAFRNTSRHRDAHGKILVWNPRVIGYTDCIKRLERVHIRI